MLCFQLSCLLRLRQQAAPTFCPIRAQDFTNIRHAAINGSLFGKQSFLGFELLSDPERMVYRPFVDALKYKYQTGTLHA